MKEGRTGENGIKRHIVTHQKCETERENTQIKKILKRQEEGKNPI